MTATVRALMVGGPLHGKVMTCQLRPLFDFSAAIPGSGPEIHLVRYGTPEQVMVNGRRVQVCYAAGLAHEDARLRDAIHLAGL